MSLVIADLVRETTQTTGTGPYTLDGTPAGTANQSFATAIGDGNRAMYVVTFGTNWEVSVGTVTAGPSNTLSRDAVLASSNGGAAVNWGPGVKDIYSDAPAALLSNPINMVVVESSGNYTPPSMLRKLLIKCQAGGGGGGGTVATSPNQRASAAGGGGGGYSEKLVLASALATSEVMTIGAGGAGGVAGPNPGQDGGSSSFGAHCSATGGKGGAGGPASTGFLSTVSGNGGLGAGGDLNLPGMAGGSGLVVDGSSFGAGVGGSSMLGRDIFAPHRDAEGTPGYGFGAGGSGAANQASDPARAGGNGAPGVIVLMEF